MSDVINRTPNDWAALRKAEKEEREPLGTSEGLMAEAMEKPMMNMNSPPLSPVSVDAIKVLVQLAELLLVPSDMQRVIAGLDKAVSDSGAAAEQAKAAQCDLARQRQDLESERAKHEAQT
jgi:hypothetical protein